MRRRLSDYEPSKLTNGKGRSMVLGLEFFVVFTIKGISGPEIHVVERAPSKTICLKKADRYEEYFEKTYGLKVEHACLFSKTNKGVI
jgi:hypothetical protein